ncbi:hypothetical protein [Mangrovibacterium sp.]|uniref:hypothetical protein n=1 Tax=Mangrovibacterium sp. TaxID=1961364 RepID=UPI00356904F7
MTNSVFSKYPKPEQMLASVGDYNSEILQVNGHFHTPYSFSAFNNISQPFDMAKQENVKVLGINDFYTTDGFEQFNALAKSSGVFPLFNIEFMSLQKDLQAAGIRVNDPNNPGRTYFSGKGLRFPVHLNVAMVDRLFQIQEESNRQTAQMIGKLNELLAEIGAGFSFTFEGVKERYAKNLVRERHIAKALREAIVDAYPVEADQKTCFTKVFSGKEPKSAMNDFAALENEIRGNLLKSGGRAFVPEDDKAFLSLEQVIELIIHAGGIPCYPVLLDNPKGEFTDFEGDYEKLYQSLVAKNVYMLELIPGRNKPEIMEEFVHFFNDRGFVITFGTEHNTPQLDPIEIFGGDGKELSPAMKKIGYQGACVIAAHQYLKSKGKVGYLQKSGKAKVDKRDEFIALGNAVIKHFLAQ